MSTFITKLWFYKKSLWSRDIILGFNYNSNLLDYLFQIHEYSSYTFLQSFTTYSRIFCVNAYTIFIKYIYREVEKTLSKITIIIGGIGFNRNKYLLLDIFIVKG